MHQLQKICIKDQQKQLYPLHDIPLLYCENKNNQKLK